MSSLGCALTPSSSDHYPRGLMYFSCKSTYYTDAVTPGMHGNEQNR